MAAEAREESCESDASEDFEDLELEDLELELEDLFFELREDCVSFEVLDVDLDLESDWGNAGAGM